MTSVLELTASTGGGWAHLMPWDQARCCPTARMEPSTGRSWPPRKVPDDRRKANATLILRKVYAGPCGWTGQPHPSAQEGYGASLTGRHVQAHRAAWLYQGQILPDRPSTSAIPDSVANGGAADVVYPDFKQGLWLKVNCEMTSNWWQKVNR